jgi:cysteinyl-tRNA synthetase
LLNVSGGKMSKSVGNILTVREVLKSAPGEAIRFMLLKAQYRATLDLTADAPQEARRELDRFYRALERTPGAAGKLPDSVLDALCDDLNTPAAFAAMHALADAALGGDADAAAGLRAAGELLGLLQAAPAKWFHADGDSEAVEAAIAERFSARKARDFARADAIRADLAAQGVLLEDGPGGTTWRRQ